MVGSSLTQAALRAARRAPCCLTSAGLLGRLPGSSSGLALTCGGAAAEAEAGGPQISAGPWQTSRGPSYATAPSAPSAPSAPQRPGPATVHRIRTCTEGSHTSSSQGCPQGGSEGICGPLVQRRNVSGCGSDHPRQLSAPPPTAPPPRRPPSAAEVLAPLLEGKPFTVTQIAGRGRGLVASRPIPVGEVVHREAPLLVSPEQAGPHPVCYHCLAPLALSPSPVRRPGGRRFCCDACVEAALGQYLAAEEAAAVAAAAAAAAAARADFSSSSSGSSGSGSNSRDPLTELYEQCRGYGERFPLMAARLAFMEVAEAVRQHLHLYGRIDRAGASASGAAVEASQQASLDAAAPPVAPAPATALGAATAGDVTRGDPLRSLHVLCFANVAPPYPEPWLEQHRLLTQALSALATDPAALRNLVAALGLGGDTAVPQSNGGTGSRTVDPPSAPQPQPPSQSPSWRGSAPAKASSRVPHSRGTGTPGQGPQPPLQSEGEGEERAAAAAEAVLLREVGEVVSAAVRERLHLDWFVGVMARLHLNVFQVHNPLAGADPSDLAAAASALVAGTAGGGSSGSAAYLLASLFNHSCEPSLDVAFPDMDGSAAFVAGRDIAPGEELTVSYLDVALPYSARRRHLEWSYGFVCGCARCREEAQQGAEARGAE